MIMTFSLQFLNDQNQLIESINITEPILDIGLNYSGTPNPWLAYGMNGSLTSVAFFSTIFYYA